MCGLMRLSVMPARSRMRLKRSVTPFFVSCRRVSERNTGPPGCPVGQLVLVWPVLIQVVKQVAQAVTPQGDAALLGTLAGHREHAMLAVKV